MTSQKIEAFDALYQNLNSAQKKAVDAIEGPVVVIAGPGTGKTQILTLRIANILRTAGAGIGPENILALTFTNAGVAAMRRRLASIIGPELAYRVGIYTFHSFAEEQMKFFPEVFKQLAFGTPLSEVEKVQVIETIVKTGEFEHIKTFASDRHYVRDILSALGKLKREGIAPEDFDNLIEKQEQNIATDESSFYKRRTGQYQVGDMKPDALKPIWKNKELAEVYHRYQKELEKMNKYDFDDMILSLRTALETNENFRADLQEQFQYILVDEHQDTNDGQNRILELLIEREDGVSPNIFTVGDDKQAIYRFQGASLENFFRFEKRFSDTKIIHLDQNYRSTQAILDTAHALIEKEQSQRKHTELTAKVDGPNDVVTIIVFPDVHSELFFLATEIKKLLDAGVPPEEIAILYRDRSGLHDLKKILEQQKISYSVNSAENLLDDPAMRKLLLLFRAVSNPFSDEALGEALLIDFLDIELIDVLTLFEHQKYGKTHTSLLTLLQGAVLDENSKTVAPEKLKAFADFVILAHKKGQNEPFLEFFDWFVRESGFLQYAIASPRHMLHLRQLETLLTAVRRNIESKPIYRLADFLEFIQTLIAYEMSLPVSLGAGSDTGVKLMTVHGAKGLEFEHVYITNVVRGKFGHKRGGGERFKLPLKEVNANNLDDERRLLYVALTRAKKYLTLTYALEDHEGREKSASHFVEELKQDRVKEEAPARYEKDLASVFATSGSELLFVTNIDFIKNKFLSTPLSVSALNNYLASPLIYFFRNLIRIPSSPTKTQMYGILVHAALEHYFADCKKEKTILPKQTLVQYFDKALDRAYLLREYREEFTKKGQKNLGDFYDHFAPTFSYRIDTEKKIKGVPFLLSDEQEITLTGVIDKIEYLPDGDVVVVDYKTGRTWSEQSKEKKESLKRQLVFYKLLIARSEEMQKKGVVMTAGKLVFVEPNRKTKQHEEIIIPINDEDVAELEEQLRQFAEEIFSGNFLRQDFVVNADTKKYLDLFMILKKGTE